MLTKAFLNNYLITLKNKMLRPEQNPINPTLSNQGIEI